MQSPSTTAKFLKVTYVLFIKGGFLEGKRLQCHVISYSDRGLASKMYFLVVCSEKGRFVWGLLVWLRPALFHGAYAGWEQHIIFQTYFKCSDITGGSLISAPAQFQSRSSEGLVAFV